MLRVEGLTAGYGGLPVIFDVRLEVKSGQLVSILGPNGCGKSTLLKAIVGILKPTSGTAELDGVAFTGRSAYSASRLGVGYVPQLANVFPSLTVVENLEMGGLALGRAAGKEVERLLERFPDLAAARRKRAGQLSGGQRNLLGIARALMGKPRALLVDEPSAGLAPANVDRIWRELAEIAKRDTAVVVVEQNVDAALHNSEYVHVLVNGRKTLEGRAASIDRAQLERVFLGEKTPSSLD